MQIDYNLKTNKQTTTKPQVQPWTCPVVLCAPDRVKKVSKFLALCEFLLSMGQFYTAQQRRIQKAYQEMICLLDKHEGLSLNPQYPRKSLVCWHYLILAWMVGRKRGAPRGSLATQLTQSISDLWIQLETLPQKLRWGMIDKDTNVRLRLLWKFLCKPGSQRSIYHLFHSADSNSVHYYSWYNDYISEAIISVDFSLSCYSVTVLVVAGCFSYPR